MILAFGWSDTHRHVFEIEDRRVGPAALDVGRPVEDERNVLVAHALPRAGDRMVLAVDFGDGWRHAITVAEVLPGPCARPRLVAAERAAPPEDCGGPPGYAQLVAALADPAHPEHARLREWAGEGYDPERCDVEVLDERLGRMAEAGGERAGAAAP